MSDSIATIEQLRRFGNESSVQACIAATLAARLTAADHLSCSRRL
jgi:hypothetical protein